MNSIEAIKVEMTKALAAEQSALAMFAKLPRFQVIDCVNASTVVSDADCAKYVSAVQTQVTRDFFPLWGIGAKLNFIPHGGKPSANAWWMVISDTSDQANALGYHSIGDQGQPLGFVFAKSDLDSGSSISVTLSHEILEVLGDPQICLTSQLDPTRFVAFENCDPVEADSDGYEIDGVLVSDFVLPSYFSPGHPAPFDFAGLLTAGMPALRPNGYLSVYVIGQGWTQIDAATSPRMKMKAVPHVGSRRQRRVTPRKDWVISSIG